MRPPDNPLPRLLVPVRPAHFETPAWYLKRLCAANAVDHAYIARIVRQRDKALNTNNALGVIIAELGGPKQTHWVSTHARASLGMTRPGDPYRVPHTTRMACTSCTAGEPAVTYDHIRFGFCLKHHRWLAGVRTTREQPVIRLDPEMLRAERLARRLVSTARADQDHYETAFRVTRHWASRSGYAATRSNTETVNTETVNTEARPSARAEGPVDHRLAFYPEAIRLTEVISSAQFANLMMTGWRGAAARRAHLRRQLHWMSAEQWIAVEAIEVWATARQQRLDCTFPGGLAASASVV